MCPYCGNDEGCVRTRIEASEYSVAYDFVKCVFSRKRKNMFEDRREPQKKQKI